MDARVESWVAAQILIEKHGPEAAYRCARRRQRIQESEGRKDLAAIWTMVKQAIGEVRRGL